MPVLFVLFIIIPILEMWLLITVGSHIGALPTIGLVFLTAIIGVTLLRQQGISTLVRANQRMRSGEIPATEMGEGIFLAVGGALLLTPGFITDAVGFACLIPGIRKWLLGRILKRVTVVQYGPRGPFGGDPFGRAPRDHGPLERDAGRDQGKDSQTIEGEYRRDD
ncbi:FxsA family protein [Proteobacteria bacterium 005FR1]|nr:FxsA family protein [Proteobacteria bacterium 005FR1]